MEFEPGVRCLSWPSTGSLTLMNLGKQYGCISCKASRSSSGCRSIRASYGVARRRPYLAGRGRRHFDHARHQSLALLPVCQPKRKHLYGQNGRESEQSSFSVRAVPYRPRCVIAQFGHDIRRRKISGQQVCLSCVFVPKSPVSQRGHGAYEGRVSDPSRLKRRLLVVFNVTNSSGELPDGRWARSSYGVSGYIQVCCSLPRRWINLVRCGNPLLSDDYPVSEYNAKVIPWHTERIPSPEINRNTNNSNPAWPPKCTREVQHRFRCWQGSCRIKLSIWRLTSL